MNTVWIGYDPREAAAYDVARNSLIRHSSIPLRVEKLSLAGLQRAGLYRRTWHMEEGRRVDDIDGLPFSTEFAFSRFLVPYLQDNQGWALFVDCDFLFMGDAAEIFAAADPTKAVMVCQQTYQPAETVKMDGQSQARYFRKNWSSLMLFNCAHPSMPSVDDVNAKTGRWLHGLVWCPDDAIGEIDPAWNWIEGTTVGRPKAVHYTAGGPWFPGFDDVAYAQEWRREHELCCHYAITDRALPNPRRYVA